MRVLFDDVGYPYSITIVEELKNVDQNDSNPYNLKPLYEKIKPLMDYWSELKPEYEKYQYGEITKSAYNKICSKLKKKYFSDKLSRVHILEWVS